MCAIDLGPESRRVLEWAGQLAAALGSRLTVVYISPALEPFLGDAYDPRWQADLTRRANEQIETLQRDLGIKAETLVEGGNDVPGAVCFAAARVEASLLVIGRKKMAGEFLGRLRTQSYALIRQSPCPVISV
jgi:nucleotide-binding universal stress UspA family protein